MIEPNGSRPTVLVCLIYDDQGLAALRSEYDVIYAPTPEETERAIAAHGELIRGVVTSSTRGIRAHEIDRLPSLRVVVTKGVGYEGVDLDATARRGIVVAHGSGNAPAVADHAFALLLCLQRGLIAVDRAVRDGAWLESRTPRPTIFGQRLGVYGLGAVGSEIAKRAVGFDMTIAYHSRGPRADVAYAWKRSVRELAENSDILVVSCPGGPATYHTVDAAVLNALGPTGVVVNVGRGTVIDSDALAAALADGRIAGAALDVVEGEPIVPDALLAAPNLIFSPHIGGRSPEIQRLSLRTVEDNLRSVFAGRPVPHPIPPPTANYPTEPQSL